MRIRSLNVEFKEFLRLLEEEGVRYLIVGGYAVAYHGHPRYTGDLDIWADPAETTTTKLIEVLRAFGFSEPQILAAKMDKVDSIITIGSEPLRSDIMRQISGVRFANSWERRVVPDTTESKCT